eukprot:scaffold1484_cov173-Amphora_coffeaeformis.AAC.4
MSPCLGIYYCCAKEPKSLQQLFIGEEFETDGEDERVDIYQVASQLFRRRCFGIMEYRKDANDEASDDNTKQTETGSKAPKDTNIADRPTDTFALDEALRQQAADVGEHPEQAGEIREQRRCDKDVEQSVDESSPSRVDRKHKKHSVQSKKKSKIKGSETEQRFEDNTREAGLGSVPLVCLLILHQICGFFLVVLIVVFVRSRSKLTKLPCGLLMNIAAILFIGDVSWLAC